MHEPVSQALALAGVGIFGDRPWDLRVHDPRFFGRVWADPHLGLGESYMDGWWDCQRLDDFFARVLGAGLEERLRITPRVALRTLAHRIFNFQGRRRAWEVAERHYDLGNDLFKAMLDSDMSYTCAYWKGARDLEEAQANKLDLVCQKLMLRPGMRILDIGCGWGAFARHAALHYGAEVVGVTLSQPQRDHAEEACRGLPATFRIQDYRDMPDETFDRVVSIGMMEAVGHKNFRTFMEIAHGKLVEDGLFLLHTVGESVPRYAADPFICKYIFPNGNAPALSQVALAMEGLFIMEDWQNFGSDYDATLMAWHRNFVHNWPSLRDRFDERFFRMWTYYLLSAAGAFRARKAQLWQIVLSRHGIPGGFQAREPRPRGPLPG